MPIHKDQSFDAILTDWRVKTEMWISKTEIARVKREIERTELPEGGLPGCPFRAGGAFLARGGGLRRCGAAAVAEGYGFHVAHELLEVRFAAVLGEDLLRHLLD